MKTNEGGTKKKCFPLLVSLVYFRRKMMQEGKAAGFEAVLDEKKKEIDAIIERWVPRAFDSDSLAHMCGKPRYAYDAESATKSIADPIWDILDRGASFPLSPPFLRPSPFSSPSWFVRRHYSDAEGQGGKRWRPVLLLLVAEALGAKLEEVKDLVAMCEVVHNGTLVVDDIEDDSKVRRGKPCVHLTYGVDVAINAGNGKESLIRPFWLMLERFWS
jgi:geranylgeranyl diphosphate synthase type I